MGSDDKLMRKVFGTKLHGGNGSALVESYERIHTGYGDGVMLRLAIIANMKRYPDRRHVLHIKANVAPIFEDIDKLEIVPIPDPDKQLGELRAAYTRYQISSAYLSRYNISNIYCMSTPCADYESANAPFVTSGKLKYKLAVDRFDEYFPKRIPTIRLERQNMPVAIATGKRIIESRQDIFCNTVGVPLDIDNYNVKFSTKEKEFAKSFLNGDSKAVGIQTHSSTTARDYVYMSDMIDYVASQVDSVVLFGTKHIYKGDRENVKCAMMPNIRNIWAIIERMSLFIGVDSFGIHAAGAVGVPTYGIFGPTDPRCRLTHYKNATWNKRWSFPVIKRGFKRGCGRQYCWYKPCKARPCLNAVSPKFYFNDAVERLGVEL